MAGIQLVRPWLSVVMLKTGVVLAQGFFLGREVPGLCGVSKSGGFRPMGVPRALMASSYGPVVGVGLQGPNYGLDAKST